MLSVARSKCPTTEFVVADVTKSLPALEPYDLVTSFRFFGNAEDELRTEVLGALSRFARSGGYLIINNHRNPSCGHVLLGRMRGFKHDMDLTKGKITKMLSHAGFRLLKSYGIGWWLARSAWMRNEILNAPYAQYLEKFGLAVGLSAVSPDMVLIAKKMH